MDLLTWPVFLVLWYFYSVGKLCFSAAGKRRRCVLVSDVQCVVFLAARYQNELAGVDTELLAERFYYQALSVAPQIGE